jgi:steroid delta-isomerase
MKKSFSPDIDERIKLAIYQRIDRFIKNSSVDNIDTIKKYFVNFENKNIEGLKRLFSDDVILADWNISAKGLPEVIDANINIFNSISSIKIIQNSTYCNENNKKFACDISVVINESETLDVVDLIEFNNNGKIKAIKAYKK